MEVFLSALELFHLHIMMHTNKNRKEDMKDTAKEYADRYPDIGLVTIKKLFNKYYSSFTVIEKGDYPEYETFKSFLEYAIGEGLEEGDIIVRKVHELGWIKENIVFMKDGFFVRLLKPIHPKNSTGYRNVYKNKSGTYYSYLYINRRPVNLGTYDTAEEAYFAYRGLIISLTSPDENHMSILEERERLDEQIRNNNIMS